MSQIKNPKIRSSTLDINQVAHLLGVSERTVYRLLDAGQIPKPLKLGHAIRWWHKDIELFVEAGSIRAFRRAKSG